MKAVVYSVPGTGTRFLCNLLRRGFGYRGDAPGPFESRHPGDDLFILRHFHFQQEPVSPPASIPVVIPIRHPVHGFLTRRREQGETVEQYAARWDRLRRFWAERNPHLFIVDDPTDTPLDRGSRLHDLIHVVKPAEVDPVYAESVVVDWAPIGRGPGEEQLEYEGTGRVQGLDLSPLDEAVAWYRTLIGRSHA